MFTWLHRNGWWLVGLAGLLVFILLKWPHLFLPAYWDEAWSYLPAVQAMADGMPGLWPGVIDVELYKGHPLFFYFLQGVWAKVFGFQLWTAKLLCLLFALLLLVQTYRVGYKLTDNRWIALVPAFLLGVHGMLLAQSTLVLPEVLMAALVLWSAFAYWQHRFWQAGFLMLLAVLTKESAIIFAGALGLHYLIGLIFRWREMPWRTMVKHLIYLSLPIAGYAIFLVWQHQLYGWWFYPDHVDRMLRGWGVLKARSQAFFDILFLFNNLRYLTVVFVIALVVVIARKQKVNGRFLSLSVLMITTFWVFSAFNFFSNRYLLVLLPLVVLSIWHVIDRGITNIALKASIGFILIGLVTWATWDKRNWGDSNPWHTKLVHMHEAAANYLVEQQAHQDTIATHFLMTYYLTKPIAGYIAPKDTFSHVFNWPIEGARWVLVSNIEQAPWLLAWKHRPDMEQVWRQSYPDVGWVEIYKRRN